MTSLCAMLSTATITSWNPAAERHFRGTAADAIGQSILPIVPEDRHATEETS
jgi:hypothetical protein